MLDTNELAIVLKPAQNPSDAERPFVKVITDTQGSAIDDGRELDLSEKDATGHYQTSIFRLVDNTEHKFDTSRYFV
jgi:tRNA(Arg) A34 adenosine deaminase TadA